MYVHTRIPNESSAYTELDSLEQAKNLGQLKIVDEEKSKGKGKALQKPRKRPRNKLSSQVWVGKRQR
jgi:hypothetical protein